MTEGRLGVFLSKTACSVIRYRAGDVVGVLDSQHAGGALESVLGLSSRPVPVKSSGAG